MKIFNDTIWRTDDMRKILLRLAKGEIYDPARRKQIRVHILYGRHSNDGCSGFAYYNGRNMTIRVQKFALNKYDFCHVAAHEMAHLEGMHHRTMGGDGRYKDRSIAKVIENWPWIESMEIRKREPRAKSILPVQEIRYQRAKTNLERAATRFKRAKTLLKKWEAKVKYYERSFAKAACAPTATE